MIPLTFLQICSFETLPYRWSCTRPAALMDNRTSVSHSDCRENVITSLTLLKATFHCIRRIYSSSSQSGTSLQLPLPYQTFQMDTSKSL